MQQDFADPNWRHPFEQFDEGELEEAMREARQTALRLMSAIVDEMPDCPEKFGIAYAIGSTSLVGRSMSEIAAKLGVTRALISTRAVSFCKRHNLPPSPYMRAADRAQP